MIKLTPVLKLTLLLALLLFSQESRSQINWPVKGQIDLSSSFGEYRPNRFHAGIDIRTGGKIGARIYTPVSGYVWRVKTSYAGYGKALYIIGDDSHIYVYGHMDSYAEKVDKPLKQTQLRSQRYYQDIVFPPDSIRVSKGEFIGRTGRTGSTAPHLHFEKRTPDNFPLNPLSHGFRIKDNVRPVFTRLGFELTDHRSLHHNGQRKILVNAVPVSGTGNYTVDTTLYLNSPFGILVEAFDQTRPGGWQQSVYKLALYFDDTLYYRITFDTLDFDVQRSVNLEYDYQRVVDNEKKVRRMYQREGNIYWRSRPVDSERGIFGLDSNTSNGPHVGRIVAQDCHGNSSELSFQFMWGRPKTIDRTNSSDEFRWDISIDYQIVSDGLLFEYCTGTYVIPHPEINLYDGDSLLGPVYLYAFGGPRGEFCFMSPSEKYRHIDSIHFSAKDGVTGDDQFVTTNIHLVGLEERQTISPDGRFTIHVGRNNFFEPRFIELIADSAVPGQYKILPEAFVCKSDFQISMASQPGRPFTRQDGLCWFDSEKNRWVWISGVDNRTDTRTAEATGGGTFRILRDTEPPDVKITSIKNGLTYFNPQHPIEFMLSDTLSDIEDDRSILIELDGNWMIPEYDPHTKICKTQPLEPLANGKHELRIAATDRAGNVAEQKLHFFVNKRKN